MPDRREDKRLPLRIKAKYGETKPDFLGFVKNLSSHGMCIEGKTALPALSLVCVRIFPKDMPEFDVQGEIRWVREFANVDLKSLMGMHLIEHPDQYSDLITSMTVKEDGEKRKHPRFDNMLEVYLDPENSDMARFTKNISMGGIFVAMEEPFKSNSLITLKIVLANEMKTLYVDSRVVFELDKEQAEHLSIEPGNGFEFQKFHEDGREILHDYLEKLRTSYYR